MARRRDVKAARRIELGMYAVAAVSYVATGYVVRSAVLNWVVGPAWFVAWVTLVTPLILRLAGIQDPDGPGNPLPDPAQPSAVPDGPPGAGTADPGPPR